MATLVAPPAPRPVLPDIPTAPLSRPEPCTRPEPGRSARPPRVLVVSGDDRCRRARVDALAAAGLQVVSCSSLRAARAALGLGLTCLVLDRSAPDGDALALVDELYCAEGAPRTVVVTAGSSEREQVEGLVAGADDVVSSGVSLGELVARVRRLVVPATPTPVAQVRRIVVGRVAIDEDRRSVTVDGDEVSLSPTQYQILVTLATQRGQAVAVRVLVERCWDAHQDRSSCAVRPQVARLRRALRDAVDIRSIRGVGYRLAATGPGGA